MIAVFAAAVRVSSYNKSIIFYVWQRLFQEKRNTQNLFINLFFSSHSEHVCRGWRNTNIEEGSKEEEKKDQKRRKPVISKPAKNILGWRHIPLFYHPHSATACETMLSDAFCVGPSTRGEKATEGNSLGPGLGRWAPASPPPRPVPPVLPTLPVPPGPSVPWWLLPPGHGFYTAGSVQPGSEQEVKRGRKKIAQMSSSRGGTCLKAWNNSWQPWEVLLEAGAVFMGSGVTTRLFINRAATQSCTVCFWQRWEPVGCDVCLC